MDYVRDRAKDGSLGKNSRIGIWHGYQVRQRGRKQKGFGVDLGWGEGQEFSSEHAEFTEFVTIWTIKEEGEFKCKFSAQTGTQDRQTQ